MHRRILFLILLLLLLIGETACTSSSTSQTSPTVQGGVELLLQASCDLNGSHCTSDELASLSAVSAMLEGRAKDGLGVSQPVIQQQGSDQLLVKLPHLANKQDVATWLTSIGKLEFIDTGATGLQVGQQVPAGSNYPVRFTGDQLDPSSIQATTDQQSGQPVVLFAFKTAARSDFAAYTQQNIGNYLTVTLDGKVIESAIIQSQITGQAAISGGNMTLQSAQQTAALMRYGALPVPLTIVSQTSLAP